MNTCQKKGCKNPSLPFFVLCLEHKREWDATEDSARASQAAIDSLQSKEKVEATKLTTEAFKLFEEFINR